MTLTFYVLHYTSDGRVQEKYFSGRVERAKCSLYSWPLCNVEELRVLSSWPGARLDVDEVLASSVWRGASFSGWLPSADEILWQR